MLPFLCDFRKNANYKILNENDHLRKNRNFSHGDKVIQWALEYECLHKSYLIGSYVNKTETSFVYKVSSKSYRKMRYLQARILQAAINTYVYRFFL